jgi:hypothetical protein
MADFDGCQWDLAGDSANGFEDGAAWIVGGGWELEHADAVADAVDAIGEGAAGVDGDGELRSHFTKHIRHRLSGCRPEAMRNETLEFT